MEPKVKREVLAALQNLRSVCIKNGVVIDFDTRNQTFAFFDAYKYVVNEEISGFEVKLKNLIG